MNIEIYEDTYNIAVNQYLSRKTAGSKRRKEAFRSKKRRSRVLRDKYGFIADGKMLSKLGKSYYNGHAQCEEWRNRCVAKRKSNSYSYKTVSERRRIEMADRKMMEYIIGIDADGALTDVSFVNLTETPGLGTKLKTNPELLVS